MTLFFLEDMREKFDLVLEGQAALGRKIDLRFDQLNEKIEINSVKIGVADFTGELVPAPLAKITLTLPDTNLSSSTSPSNS